MTFARAWLAIELRRRWRSLTVLLLLVAVATGVVITTLAAARRGASALTRLQSRTLPATVDVLANTPQFDWSRIKALPEVAAFSNFIVDDYAAIAGMPHANVGFPPVDAAMLNTLERPVVRAGRNLNPTRADEAVVTQNFASYNHKPVGSTVVLELPSARQVATSQLDTPGTRPSGPRITLHIVGIVVSPWLSDEPDNPGGGLQLSPAVVARYPLETLGRPGPDNSQFINSLVRLRRGEADVPRFRDDVARVTGRDDIYIGDQLQEKAGIQRHIAFQSRCLVAFAVAAFLAALFLVGQAIARYAASTTTELQLLTPSGLTPRHGAGVAAAAPSLAGLGGALIGAAAAYGASRWFPFGTAAYYEPSPGLSFDGLVVPAVVAATVLLVAAGAMTAARVAIGAGRRRTADARSSLATAAARRGLPVPVVIGTRFALETGRTGIPVRPALVGSVIGVLGTVAAFTFAHGVSDAAHDPERYGQTFQLADFVGFDNHDFAPSRAIYRSLARDADVTGLADSRTAVATNPLGTSSVTLWELQTDPKPLPLVLFSGRAPTRADEVVLAPRSLRDLHAHVGSRVVLIGNRRGPHRTLTVTGSGLVVSGPHNDYYDGGWVTTAGYDVLFTGFKFHMQLIRVRPGRPLAAEEKRLSDAIGKAVPSARGLEVSPPDLPLEASLIRQVERLPILLGLFLVVLAIGAVGHALTTAVRRRAHDFAVLRSLGMTRRQCRVVVITQASVLALFGLVFGLPLGYAIGRTVWRAVADYTPLQYVPPIAVWALVLVGPAAILIANLLAAWPGHRAARLRIAHVLRAE